MRVMWGLKFRVNPVIQSGKSTTPIPNDNNQMQLTIWSCIVRKINVYINIKRCECEFNTYTACDVIKWLFSESKTYSAIVPVFTRFNLSETLPCIIVYSISSERICLPIESESNWNWNELNQNVVNKESNWENVLLNGSRSKRHCSKGFKRFQTTNKGLIKLNDRSFKN